MEKEIQRKLLDRLFKDEYRKLVNFVRKDFEARFFEASPEDIIQDVALGLIERLDLNAQIGNLTGYIYRSVQNRIIDYRKKKQRNFPIETLGRKGEDQFTAEAGDDNLDEQDVYEGIDTETLREAISQLRPDEQAIIIATVFEQHTFEEVSEEWNIPIGTLLSRKHRALSKLHKILINKSIS